ncbi:MAG: acyloxyacyl hydrolase [Oligoflexia bacterium]|nr:acyloxyacyl hydrolase [Oligoflexia bacterium]
MGGYRRGDGPELYQTLEFCLGVSVLARISDQARVGLQVFHISNAGLATKDPGANSFVAVFEHAL